MNEGLPGGRSAPMPQSPACNCVQIARGVWGDLKQAHAAADFARAITLSMLKSGTNSPWAACSAPSDRCARNAASRLDLSSSSRKAARTTSLADANLPDVISVWMKLSQCGDRVREVDAMGVPLQWNVLNEYSRLMNKSTSACNTIAKLQKFGFENSWFYAILYGGSELPSKSPES